MPAKKLASGISESFFFFSSYRLNMALALTEVSGQVCMPRLVLINGVRPCQLKRLSTIKIDPEIRIVVQTQERLNLCPRAF
jgi:hypothetical protein